MPPRSHRAVRPQPQRAEFRPEPASGVAAWLLSSEARALDDAGLLSSLGCRLRIAGLVFDRLAFHVATLHPEVFARILAWAPNEPVEIYERDHPATVAAGLPGSPFRQAAGLREKLVVQAVDPQFFGRAAGRLLQTRGVGEIVSAAFGERSGRTVVASFCTARPNVFGAADHRIMDTILLRLQTVDAWARPINRKAAIRLP